MYPSDSPIAIKSPKLEWVYRTLMDVANGPESYNNVPYLGSHATTLPSLYAAIRYLFLSGLR